MQFKFSVEDNENALITFRKLLGCSLEIEPHFEFYRSTEIAREDSFTTAKVISAEASNSDKNKRGNSFQRVLSYLLNLCKEFDYIVDFSENYSKGMPNYSDQGQFKAPYIIEFSDNTDWLVFTTTSLRDRIKQQYWDALNLKQLDKKITEAYLVYPDILSEKEKHNFIIKNEKIQSLIEYSSLEGLLSQDSFFNRIEEYALRNLTDNQRRDKKGKNFERRVAATLDNPVNFEKWKNNDKGIEGLHYQMFITILSAFNVDRNDVKLIKSTADKDTIGYLPSGGDVKTDVLTEITFNDGTVKYYTISCKRSSKSSVSVHQYSANEFADVLDSGNTELRRVLLEFQRAGSRSGMKEADALILEREIQPYILPLCEWALGGFGGKGDPEKHWANYILIYDNNTESARIHSTKEYCRLLANDCTRAFHTPFSWSYQGNRGTNIQLTCPINL